MWFLRFLSKIGKAIKHKLNEFAKMVHFSKYSGYPDRLRGEDYVSLHVSELNVQN